MAHSAGSGRATLDCTDLVPTERFDAWTDSVNRSFVPLVADARTPESRTNFDGRLVSQTLGPTQISTVQGSAVRVRRTDLQIARENPGFIKLGLQLRGYSVVTQDGRDAALAPGDFALYDTTRPYLLDFDASFRMFVVMFPLDALRMDRGAVQRLTASRFSGRQGLGAITSQFLTAMSRQLDESALGGELPLSDAVFDLLAATIADRMEETDQLDEKAWRRGLMARIETYIAAHLSDADLTVTRIADAHHISVRLLQKLFEDRNETVSGWIRRRRLDQSRRDLGNPALSTQQISSVGARWGFADAAAFARAFRGEFGVTPSDYRATHRRPRG